MSSISSIPASVQVKPPEASQPQTPAPKNDSDADEARAAASQPVHAPLPPGQGIRVDQIA